MLIISLKRKRKVESKYPEGWVVAETEVGPLIVGICKKKKDDNVEV